LKPGVNTGIRKKGVNPRLVLKRIVARRKKGKRTEKTESERAEKSSFGPANGKGGTCEKDLAPDLTEKRGIKGKWGKMRGKNRTEQVKACMYAK